ncbi:metastasis-associated protein MTA3-like [Watersipora subatra]|uniref:metastasis-associated protein MTA3-like n=1 Tax=Watersipora subatra TaxID=2589382 RepID=UPI00355C3FFC
MSANMYRVGDHVYFETSSSQPYQIRRIEELNKTPTGNVEAKVMCYFRRRDLPTTLTQLADKHQASIEEEQQESIEGFKELNDQERHLQRHLELFLSRQVETVPATHIRGKCSVTLLNETESARAYIGREHSFYYSLVYDPQVKTLLADKGEIRVGTGYQSQITALLAEGEDDNRDLADLEELVYQPDHKLEDQQIDQFLVLARSVGTFGRALDCTSTVRQPSLHMSAAAASRDITLFHAMDSLHEHEYDLTKATLNLVGAGGPVLCRDEMEEWSAAEANLFEEALEKYGKDFVDIRQDFLPWKTLKCVIEYYYMWKTTDRYVQQKRVKAAENESKLKQVYIPSYNKPNPNLISGKLTESQMGGRPCQGCSTERADAWYAWGALQLQYRLCDHCWSYWKHMGGLKNNSAKTESERPSPAGRLERTAQVQNPIAKIELTSCMPGVARYKQLADMGSASCRCSIAGCLKEFRHKASLARHMMVAHGISVRASSPKPIMKTRTAFCLITTSLTRLSRVLCRDILKPRHAARNPTKSINANHIKTECHFRLPKAVAGTLKVGKKTKAKAVAILSKMSDESVVVGHAPTPSITPKETMPKKRSHEAGGPDPKRAMGVIRHGADSSPVSSASTPPPQLYFGSERDAS